MKRIISLFAVFVLLLSFPLTVLASAHNNIIEMDNGYIEYYEDGSYAIVEIIDSEIETRATGVKKDKIYAYYSSSDKLEWTVTVTGIFNYDGKTSICTNAVTSYKIYNDSWKVTEAKASKSGATAIGEFTVKKYFLGIPIKTINKTVTLTCSKDGKFS